MNTQCLPPVMRRALALSFLPWFRLELPGWFRISGPLGLCIGEEKLWSGLPVAVIRGKLHGYQMHLHLEDWCDRLTYFIGRYYELELQKLLQAALKPGDAFIDAGANVGMITLAAAHAVGPSGRLFAFEPCPSNVERLQESIESNHLSNVTVYPIGAGDQEGELPFQIVRESKGWSTFAFRPQVPGLTFDIVKVPVRRLDDVLPRDLGPRTFVKIDVEGFECRVLRGMDHLFRQFPAVMTELEPQLLKNAGASSTELQTFMRERGYDCFYFEWVRSGFVSRLALRSVTGDIDPSVARNVLWLHPRSVFKERLARFCR